MMVSSRAVEAEIRRIEHGPREGELPSGVGTVRFIVACPFGSAPVLERARDLLQAVLVNSMSGVWPNDETWLGLLPEWFVRASPRALTDAEMEAYIQKWNLMTPEQQANADAERAWPILDWLYWMSPERRPWRWWDAADLSSVDHVAMAVEVDSWPFPWGALRWMFKAAGASTVTPESEKS